MHRISSLSTALVIGLIITATVFGALILSLRGQPTTISELPSPTLVLDAGLPSPTPLPALTHTATPATAAPVTAAPTATLTPVPTVCPIPVDWQRYSVGPFDTLMSIAQRFNLTPDQLARTNCLAAPVISVGQTIYVPGFRPTPTSAPCSPPFNWARYVVRPGDTLSSIALRYGISVVALMRANCLTTTYIYSGQMLFVPPVFPSVTLPPTPIIPTATPTLPIVSPTPTIPPVDTPTVPPIDTPTVPPVDTPTVPPIDTPTIPPVDTPTVPPIDTPTIPPVATSTTPAGSLPPSNTPEPPPTVTSTL